MGSFGPPETTMGNKDPWVWCNFYLTECFPVDFEGELKAGSSCLFVQVVRTKKKKKESSDKK